jgi:hypothetical protein
LVVHAAAWLVCPVWVPYDPAGQSVHDVAAAADHAPAGHVAQLEPLRKDPARHDAVPAKVTPPDLRVHEDVATVDADAPSAKHRKVVGAMLSNCVGDPGVNEYDVGDAESAPVGDTVATDHVGVPV